jgi:putative component of membrane protein insertase Oxa1/YidC/SpoIIIJ protein YidD
MKFLLLGMIQLYWKLIPKHKRRSCVFMESCSNFVYRKTRKDGFFSGLMSLKKRFSQCRPGYTLYKNDHNGRFELHLKDGSIVMEEQISPTMLPPYNYNYLIKN